MLQFIYVIEITPSNYRVTTANPWHVYKTEEIVELSTADQDEHLSEAIVRKRRYLSWTRKPEEPNYSIIAQNSMQYVKAYIRELYK